MVETVAKLALRHRLIEVEYILLKYNCYVFFSNLIYAFC